MGTSGNAAWGEGAAADVTEPAEALKILGYGVNEIPTHEEWNWLLQQAGRNGVRRFDTAQDLVASLRAIDPGLVNSEDFGIVRAWNGTVGYYLKYTQVVNAPALATEYNLCSDGEWLWTTILSGAEFIIRRREREFATVSLDQAAGTFVYPLIATAGGHVYVVDDNAGVPSLQAYDRDTLAFLYQIALPAAATPRAIATNGSTVAVAADNHLRVYTDSGAALVLVGSYDHTAQINHVVMGQDRMIMGGVTPGGGPPHNQIRIVSNAGPGLMYSLSRTGNPAVDCVDFDNKAIVFCGAIDGANRTGMWRSRLSTLRLEAAPVTNKVILHDGNLGMAQGNDLVWYEPNGGESIESFTHPGAIHNLCHDYEAIFTLCTDGAVRRITRFSASDHPMMFAVVPRSLNGTIGVAHATAVPSLLRPIQR